MPASKAETLLTFFTAMAVALWGVWSSALQLLVAFMVADYLTGCLLAILKGGGLNSRVGAIGLLKKIGMLGLVAMGHQIDLVMGTSFLRDICATFYLANEAISILENLGKLGIPFPPALLKAIEVLKEKGDQTGPSDSESASQQGTLKKGAAE